MLQRPPAGDTGSAVIEGVASMASVFIMLTVLVQVSLAMSARSAADAATAASARRLALSGADAASEAARLTDEILAVVPGAVDVTAAVEVTPDSASAEVGFGWTPPGPVLVPIQIRARAEVPRATPP